MKTTTASFFAIVSAGLLALGVSATGCELVAGVDRSQIPGAGGELGSTSSSGGAGGVGAAGGTGAEGGGGGAVTVSSSSASAGGGGQGGTGGSVGGGGQGGTGGNVGGGGQGGVGGTGGIGGAGGSSGGGGTGGAECVDETECSDTGNECIGRTCITGHCGTENLPSGTVTTAQTSGDCKQTECDGNGATTDVPHDGDLPDDNKACTDDVCNSGVPTNPPKASGTSCGSGLVCDGGGNCIGCNVPTDCPGTDTQCQTRTCNAGVCGFTFTAAGFVVSAQTSADCKQNQCDGNGAIVSVNDNADLPVDANQCTNDVCTTGTPSNPPTPSGSPCNQGGTVCNGSGACVQCVSATTCPGTDTDCQTRTCTAGVCGFSFASAGTPTSSQTPGDCKQNQCNGTGGIVSVNVDADVPVDGHQCTGDVCTAGVPTNPPVASGTTCTEAGGSVCNATGQCVQCVSASTCPGTDTACQTRTCTAGTCGFSFAPSGTVTPTQTPGDCKQNQCNGTGSIVSVNLDSDVPVDGQQCTGDVCTAGVPSNPPLGSGTACNQNGGNQCNGAGQCVGCTQANQCPGVDTECQTRTCTAGTCGFSFAPSGTVTTAQTTGDCKQNQCNGTGSIVAVNLDTDVPVDLNQCTSDVCTAGVPSNPPTAPHSACNQSGGTICDGTGNCVQCISGTDCASGVCSANVCQAPTCIDTVKNGTETGIDCGGGTCPACPAGQGCGMPLDCQSFVCTGLVCQAPTCVDGVQNGTETAVDCGGSCPPCIMSVTATTPLDAATQVAVTPGTLTVTFNGAMNPASLTLKTALDAGACTGAIQLSTDDFATCAPFAAATPAMSAGDTVATLTPAPGMAFGSTYKLRVTAAAAGALGQPTTPFTMATGFATRTDAASNVVISQVFGGGGNAGAPFTNDFIELHNRGTLPVSLAGWSVQYTSSGGTTWTNITPLIGTIQPGAYYLIQEASQAAVGAPLPTPDVVAASPIAMSATSGKVALVNSTVALVGGCPSGASIVDFVGYGTAATCSEGAPTANTSATTSATRRVSSCMDTSSNILDTTIGTVTPHNTSTTQACAGPSRNETGAAGEADFCNVQFPQSLVLATGAPSGDVFGRVFEAGVTEANGDSGAIVAQLGYGPRTLNPEWEPGWTWVTATYNVQSGNDDEYKASFNAPAPGSYAYAYRFSIDGGATWTYCDDVSGAGSNASLSFETPRLYALDVTP